MEKRVMAADAVGPVARGHPWVYRGGVRGAVKPGQEVLLVDGRGRPVAWGLGDHGDIVVRVLGRRPEPIEGLVARRLAAALEHRARVVPPDTDAWRLVNGEGDGLPGVVVDRYADVLVLRLYSLAWESHLDTLLDALRALDLGRTVVRRLGVGRVDGEQGIVLLHGPPPPEVLHVREHGIVLPVRVSRGQKTGLFLDQRENRRRVGAWSRGMTLVNLFGYTGGFSIYAAVNGARRTVTVDLAADALDDAREGFRLNGLDPDRHGFERADAFRWSPSEPAGVVVCDPPSLSRDASSDNRARGAYRELNRHAASMVEDGGLLVTASCTARVREDRWLEAVRRGLGSAGGRWSQVCRAAEPPDHPVGLGHPEGSYLKMAAFWRRAGEGA